MIRAPAGNIEILFNGSKSVEALHLSQFEKVVALSSLREWGETEADRIVRDSFENNFNSEGGIGAVRWQPLTAEYVKRRKSAHPILQRTKELKNAVLNSGGKTEPYGADYTRTWPDLDKFSRMALAKYIAHQTGKSRWDNYPIRRMVKFTGYDAVNLTRSLHAYINRKLSVMGYR